MSLLRGSVSRLVDCHFSMGVVGRAGAVGGAGGRVRGGGSAGHVVAGRGAVDCCGASLGLLMPHTTNVWSGTKRGTRLRGGRVGVMGCRLPSSCRFFIGRPCWLHGRVAAGRLCDPSTEDMSQPSESSFASGADDPSGAPLSGSTERNCNLDSLSTFSGAPLSGATERNCNLDSLSTCGPTAILLLFFLPNRPHE